MTDDVKTEREPLLGCPFCGRDAEVIERPQFEHDPHRFACFIACHGGKYSAHAHHCGFADTQEEARSLAVAAWNRRIARSTPVANGALAAGISLIRCLVEAHLDAARGLDKASDEDAAAHRQTATDLAAVADAAEGVTITEEQRREIAEALLVYEHASVPKAFRRLKAALQPIHRKP